MASQSKSDSARANGSKSRGPVTEEGKARSSQNARKHGLCASFDTLPDESQAGFDEFLAHHEALFQPVGGVECDLVRTLAILRWRLRRIPDMETAILDNERVLAEDEIDEQFNHIDDIGRLGFVFRKLADASQALPLLIRYESSLTRVYDRTFKHLTALQQLRCGTAMRKHAGRSQELRNEPKPPTSSPAPTPPSPSPSTGHEPPAPPAIGPCLPNRHSVDLPRESSRCGARMAGDPVFPKLSLRSRRAPNHGGVGQYCCGLFFSPRLRIRSTSSSSSIGAEGFRRACP